MRSYSTIIGQVSSSPFATGALPLRIIAISLIIIISSQAESGSKKSNSKVLQFHIVMRLAEAVPLHAQHRLRLLSALHADASNQIWFAALGVKPITRASAISEAALLAILETYSSRVGVESGSPSKFCGVARTCCVLHIFFDHFFSLCPYLLCPILLLQSSAH